MHPLKKWIFVAVFISGSFFGAIPDMNAQVINDNRPAIWPSITLKKSVGEHWRFRVEHGTRFQFRPYFTDKIYIQAGGAYLIRHNIGLELGYRFAFDNDLDDGMIPSHRISVEADLETNIKRLYLIFHPTVQTTFSRANRKDNINPLWCYRAKGVFKYDIAKTSIEPFAYLEVFLGRRPQASFTAYKYRVAIGLSGDLTKKLSMSGSLLQQGGFFNTDLNSASVLNLEWSYKF
jgi:hypothetical protein